MTLLFDENLSPSLVRALTQEFPRARHVRDVGLRGSDDRRVWDHARQHACVIVSKDTDFRERSYVEGFPPKVVWLDVGNGNTRSIIDLLKRERRRVEAFIVESDPTVILDANAVAAGERAIERFEGREAENGGHAVRRRHDARIIRYQFADACPDATADRGRH